VGDSITISDGSGGDRLSKEVEASLVAKRTPWPIGLHSVEERRKKEEEERVWEPQQQLQEEQQQLQQEGEGGEGQRQQGERLEELLEKHRQQELLELQRQQQRQSQQLEELLDLPPRSPPQPVSPSPQRPETGEVGLVVYGPPTPAWLCPGAPASIPAEPGRVDGAVALACAMRTPVDPQSEIKGTIYGIEGITLGFLRERRPWENHNAAEEDEAGTSGGGDTGETGAWRTVDDDGRFPSLIDLFLCHGGPLETVQELIWGVKARMEDKMENWGPSRITFIEVIKIYNFYFGYLFI